MTPPAEKAKEIEAMQGYKPGRKQTKEIKEAATLELLASAFVKTHITRGWFDSIFQMPFFMELEKPAAQELIVDPDQVGRILELIHKAQEPEQRAIRQRNREREKRQLHASIVSLAA